MNNQKVAKELLKLAKILLSDSKKPSFNKIVEDLKKKSPLKKLDNDTKLPYSFDLHWDIKTGMDILRFNVQDDSALHQELAKNGFDVKDWQKRLPHLMQEYEKWKNS